jgi:hypothetical protein
LSVFLHGDCNYLIDYHLKQSRATRKQIKKTNPLIKEGGKYLLHLQVNEISHRQ